MAYKRIPGGDLMYVDPSLDDGYVRVQPYCGTAEVFMNQATADALAWPGDVILRLWDVIEAQGYQESTFLLPRAVIEPEAAQELRLGLTLAEPVRSTHCAFGPCVLPATVDRPEGFSLCEHHDALMSDWDDLVA